MAETKTTRISGVDGVLDERKIGAFASGLRGEIIRPGDPNYDEVRKVWNGMIERRPALIARPRSAADVIRAVCFARDNGILLAVRGGGHNVAGTGAVDGGLLLDLSPMKGIHVDPERRTVRAEGGVTIGELDERTQIFGLATPMGVVSKTGIAGLTLNGGVGWLRRKHGLSSDNLVSVDIVTADGRFLTASETENADLFWGVRGGGGNFGVVTSFEYRLHPVGPEVMFCFVFYPGEHAREVLRSINEYMAHAPDEVSPLSFLGRVPSDEAFPEEWHGKQFVAVAAMYVGEVEEGERILAPLRELGDEAIADFSGPMPYVEAQKLLDEDYPDGGRYYWKSTNANELSGEAIERLIAHAEAAPSGHSTIDVWYHGGAMGRVGASDTAFADRDSSILLGIEANWEEPNDDEANVAWAREVVRDMSRFSDGGMYLNFPGFLEEGEGMVRGAYGENYERLAALKTEYDPRNLFRVNANIKPVAS
jgi:FAD/FMN-containing dehydrogenase